jgi:hypothetical protein
MGKFNKTVKNKSGQRGGTVRFNRVLQRWENHAPGNPNTESWKYSQNEVDALNRLRAGVVTGQSTQSYHPGQNWYIIEAGQPIPMDGNSLEIIIDKIYQKNPVQAIDNFRASESDLSSATTGRERDAARYPDNNVQADGHRAYLNALSNLVKILRKYTNPGIFTGTTKQSDLTDDNDSESHKPRDKEARWKQGGRKSRKSKKTKKFRKSRKRRKTRK